MNVGIKNSSASDRDNIIKWVKYMYNIYPDGQIISSWVTKEDRSYIGFIVINLDYKTKKKPIKII